MVVNDDIKLLAKRAFELAQLPESDRPAHKWEALTVNGQIIGAATPAGIERAKAETETRWGAQIRAQGLAALIDPWWYLRSDDGKPPVIAGLVESAMTNPDRPLVSVLRSFAGVEAEKRAALTDQVRAFLGRSFAGALAAAVTSGIFRRVLAGAVSVALAVGAEVEICSSQTLPLRV